ncbi:MAG: hypothetical protein U0414_07750 [Polyangiaceae bacterium]
MSNRTALVFSLSLSLFGSVGCDDATTTGSGGAGTSSSSTSKTVASGTTSATTSASGSTGSGTPNGSAGCGTTASETPGSFVAKKLDVGGVARDYFLYLPPGYDPTRAYPVVYQFHGCSSSPNKEDNNVPIEKHSGGDAIIVRGRAVGDCWDSSSNGPDVAFFDAMVAAIEAGYCADTPRRVAAGYSSGSFMTHALACARGDALRAVASIAGGQTGSNCTGDVAALLIHDQDDGTVNISASIGARDQYLAANGCAMTTQPFDPAPCMQYDGCKAGDPVVWCQTSGKGHDRQDGLAGPAFWNFLSKL